MRTVSIYVAAIAFAMICFVSGTNEDWQKAKEECKTELKITEEIKDKKPDFTDPKMKCFAACLMKKMGTLVNNKIDSEKLSEQFAEWVKKENSEDLKNEVKDCVKANEDKTEECQLASSLSECIFKLKERHSTTVGA